MVQRQHKIIQSLSKHEKLSGLGLSVILEKNEMIKLFLSFNSDINFQNDRGVTPFMQAIATRKEDIVGLLLKKGGIDFNLTDDLNRTACDYIDFYKFEEIRSQIPQCQMKRINEIN